MTLSVLIVKHQLKGTEGLYWLPIFIVVKRLPGLSFPIIIIIFTIIIIIIKIITLYVNLGDVEKAL